MRNEEASLICSPAYALFHEFRTALSIKAGLHIGNLVAGHKAGQVGGRAPRWRLRFSDSLLSRREVSGIGLRMGSVSAADMLQDILYRMHGRSLFVTDFDPDLVLQLQ